MPPLKDLLKKRLEGARRVAVLAVGSSLRGDDAAGLRAAEELGRLLAPPPAELGCRGLTRLVRQPTSRPQESEDVGCVKQRRNPRHQDSSPPSPDVRIFLGETAPENLTGEIKRYQPTHLVLLDAAHFGGAPGEAAMISPDEIRGNPSISSHNLPLNVLTDYLVSHLQCEVVILGVQPASSGFGEPVGAAAAAGAKALARMLADCLHV